MKYNFLKWFLLLMVLFLAACQAEAEPSPTAAPTDTPTPLPLPTEETQPAAATEEEATAEPTAEPTAIPVVLTDFTIVPDKSEVRFSIDEVLFGDPKTVIGRTSELSGTLMIDLNNPQASAVGPIEIDARSLETDSSFRNRALRRQILNSSEDQYQFITFTPTSVAGLPETVAIGEEISFQITGDLKIRDITQLVTFDMMVTPNSETELEGSGAAVVLRSDFELEIPEVTGVADVANAVTLEIDFVAEATGP